MMYGISAEKWWTGNEHCVKLEREDVEGSATGESEEVVFTATHVLDGAEVEGTVTATPVTGTIEPESADTPATFTITVTTGEADASSNVEFRSFRGVAESNVAIPARGYKVELGDPAGLTLTGAKCDGPVGAWNLVMGGTVTDAGFTVVFAGTLDFVVAEDLSATYQVSLRGTAEGLPAAMSAALDFDGQGTARFVDPESGDPSFELLDGDLVVTGSGAGPGVSIGGIITTSPAGTGMLPVLRSACGDSAP